MDYKIPFGLKNGQYIDVSKVDSGLACNCICPSCGQPLQANKGSIKTHYFSHAPSNKVKSCINPTLKSIAGMTRSIVSQNTNIWVPELTIRKQQTGIYGQPISTSKQLVEEQQSTITKIDASDQSINFYALGELNRTHSIILIEFIFDNEKLIIPTEFQHLPRLRINFKRQDRKMLFNLSVLTELVSELGFHKTWSFHPSETSVDSELKEQLLVKIQKSNRQIRTARQRIQAESIKSRANNKKSEPTKPGKLAKYLRCEACLEIHTLSMEQFKDSLKIGFFECPHCSHSISLNSPQ